MLWDQSVEPKEVGLLGKQQALCLCAYTHSHKELLLLSVLVLCGPSSQLFYDTHSHNEDKLPIVAMSPRK